MNDYRDPEYIAKLAKDVPALAEPVNEVGLTEHEPLGSLVAAASRQTSKQTVARTGNASKDGGGWMADAWDMYDLVGEQRFLANTLANRLAQARLFPGKLPVDSTEEVIPVEDGIAHEVFQSVRLALKQMMPRLGVNLFIAGGGYICGIPRYLMPDYDYPNMDGNTPRPDQMITPNGKPDPRNGEKPGKIDLTDLEWRMFSDAEVMRKDDQVELMLGEDINDKITVNVDDIFLIRVWKPHPRRHWQSDSPTRSSLPVLRELVGLTMHVSAQTDSRLAGAGLLILPESVRRSLSAQYDNDSDPLDEFTRDLIDAMVTPISDRSNASAVVPLIMTVPDESVQHVKYINFSGPLDSEARGLRDEAIRRLALGQDCPPELLLGLTGMNHWGAWLVREDVVNTHLEPPLAMICDALTTQFYWPVLEQQGLTEEQARQFCIWYDVAHLIIRPNRIKDAFALHAVGAISDETLRDAAGFDDDDAPNFGVIAGGDPVFTLALSLVRQNPALLAAPGLKTIVDQLQAMMDGEEIPMPMQAALHDGPRDLVKEGVKGTGGVESGNSNNPLRRAIKEPTEIGPTGNDGSDMPDDQSTN